MANDLIELNIAVKDQSVKQAVTTVSRLERELVRAVKAIDDGTMSQKRFNEVLQSARQQYKTYAGNAGLATINLNKFVKETQASVTAQKQAAQAAKEANEAAKEAARVAKEQARIAREQAAEEAKKNRALEESARAYRQLKASIDPTYRAQQGLIQTKKLLRQQIVQGNITMEEAVATMRRYREAQVAMSSSGVGNTRSMNAMGMAIQQTGYQVGDFLVQVQSGTNVMVAFGQQATQLVGILPMMAEQFGMNVNRLVAIASIAGIIIPLVTAIGAAFMRTREGTDEATDAAKSLNQELQSLDSTLEKWVLTKKAAEAGITVEEFLGLGGIEKAEENLKSAKKALEELTELVTSPGYGAAGGISLDFFKGFFDADTVSKYEAAVKSVEDAEQRLADLRKKQSEDRLESFNEEQKRLQQEVALLTMSVQFGEDSLQVRQLENQQQQENYELELRKMGLTESQVQELVELLRVQQGVTEELRQSEAASSGLNNSLEDAVNEAIDLRNALADADSAIQSLGLDVERKIAVIRARNLAIQQGTNEAVAGEVALLKQKRNEITQNLAASGASIDQIAAETEEVSAQINEYEKLRGENVKLRESMKTTGKSGGRAMKEVEDSVRTVRDVFKDAVVTAEEFELQMAEGVVSAVDSVANAWGDFVMRGFQDFKGFVASVWSSFKSLISNMIATAAKNKILISLGLGGGATAGTMAGAAQSVAGASSGLLGGSGFLGLGGGDGSVFGGSGLLGAGGGSGFLGLGAGSGLATTFGGGALGTIASYALPIAGVAMLVAGFFKKTKEIVANGVRIQLDGVEAELASYEKSKTTNGFGFSSGFSRDFTRLDDAVQDAVSARIGATVQNLGALGLGTNLTGFSFSKRTEVKEGETFEGESEEVIRAALDAAVEFATQGALDGFTRAGETLSETLDRLVISLQAANPILQLLGGSALDISVNGADAASKLIELSGGLEAFAAKSDYLFQNFLTLEEQQTRLADAAKVVISDFEQFYNVALPETHAEFMALVNAQDLNTEAGRQLRAALQDVADEFITVKGTAEEAVGALRDLGADTASFESAIRQQQSLISRAVDALVKPLQEALDRTKTQAERSFRIFSEAADKTRDEAQSIVDILTDVISSRVIQSEAVERMRYQQAQQQLESFAGGADFTPDQLRRATEGVDIDTTKFFGSFEDYARDFYRTQISLTKLADKAEGELTDVEKQIDIAEKAYEVALGTYQESQDFNTALNQLLTDLSVYTETAARNEPFIEQIKAEGDRQVDLLDQILVETKKQVNDFLGLETPLADLVGTNVSVGEALEILGKEGSDLSGAVMALEPFVDTIGSHIAELDLTLGGAVDRLGLNLEDLVSLDLTAGFENLDLFKPLTDMDFGEKFKPITDFFSELDLAGNFSEINLAEAFNQVNLAEGFSEINLAEAFQNLDLSGPLSEQVQKLSDMDIVGDLQEPLSGLQSEISFLDETASGLNLGVVGLDGSVALLSSSVGTHSENLLTLNGTIVDDLGVKLENLGTNTGTLNVVVGNLSSATGNLSLSVTNFGQTFSTAASTLTGMVSSLSSSVSSLAGAQRAQAAAQQAAAQAAAAQAAADAARSEQIRSPLVDTAVETYVPNTSSGVDMDSRSLTSRAFSSLRSGASFATGGMHIGGMRLVGEQGPELEVTGPSRIYSAQQTKNMLSGGSSEAASEIRMLRREVSELRAEQRKIGVENVKYNKKSYDLNREWDIVGLPATRT